MKAVMCAGTFDKDRTIHLPADAIYKTFEDYEGGDSFLVSQKARVEDRDFVKYKGLAKAVSDDYEISLDGKIQEEFGKKRLRLMLWTASKAMAQYISERISSKSG